MVNVYLTPPTVTSKSLNRVTDALIRYRPDGVAIVDDPTKADLTILHAIGRQNQLYNQAKGKYVVIQYALKSTLTPSVRSWLRLWEGAELVWSYYDLEQICEDEKVIPEFNFYHSPLGADSKVFKPQNTGKRYQILTSGQSYLTESVRECYHASNRIIHLGADLGRDFDCIYNVSDEVLAHYYNLSHYVSGLRRIEGFELPAAEGALCGVKPILFDKPHYRSWYNDIGIFIPEGNREQTINNLKLLFEGTPSRLTDYQIEIAKNRFNWQTIITEFWRRLYDNS